MANFRKVYTKFWTDSKVIDDFTPEDKLFWIYLLTNKNTTMIGVYKLIPKIAALEVGYSTDTIFNLLRRFEDHHKMIKYNKKTKEIAILNWGAYNLNKGGKPVESCINSELKNIEDKSLISFVVSNPKAEISESIKSILISLDVDVDVDEDEDEDEARARTRPRTRGNNYEKIITYLNLKTNKNYKHTTKKTQSLINARFKEGFSLEDFYRVIEIKTIKWLKDPKMNAFLRPETLFGTKFDGYLNEEVTAVDEGKISERMAKNIKIAEEWLKENGEN